MLFISLHSEVKQSNIFYFPYQNTGATTWLQNKQKLFVWLFDVFLFDPCFDTPLLYSVLLLGFFLKQIPHNCFLLTPWGLLNQALTALPLHDTFEQVDWHYKQRLTD